MCGARLHWSQCQQGPLSLLEKQTCHVPLPYMHSASFNQYLSSSVQFFACGRSCVCALQSELHAPLQRVRVPLGTPTVSKLSLTL